MNLPDNAVDWVVCGRRLAGNPTRELTVAEKHIVARAVLAGGGSHNEVALALGCSHTSAVTLVKKISDRPGFPVVDGVTLTWKPPPSMRDHRAEQLENF